MTRYGYFLSCEEYRPADQARKTMHRLWPT
jgi:hypothetical protein